jgi:Choline dehydrogenase and related flavoproteins
MNPKYVSFTFLRNVLTITFISYLQTPEDVSKLLRGARVILQLAQTEPLASLLDPEFKRSDLDHELHLKSDAELIEIIKERVETVYHPTSTCRMAPLAKDGVVDSQQRVYGIRGLRVCDASIFPWIVSGHTVGGLVKLCS